MLKLLVAIDAGCIVFGSGPFATIGMMLLTPIIMLLLACKLPGIIAGAIRPQKIM